MTPQEYADKYNVYVARDRDGTWHTYSNKPIAVNEWNVWANRQGSFKKPTIVEIHNHTYPWSASLICPRSFDPQEYFRKEHKERYQPGQLILCWERDRNKEYAMVRHFVSYDGDAVRVVNLSGSSTKPVRFWRHRPFNRKLAETRLKEWPREYLQDRCATCGRDY